LLTPIAFRTPLNLLRAAPVAAALVSCAKAGDERSWKSYNFGNANYAAACSHPHRHHQSSGRHSDRFFNRELDHQRATVIRDKYYLYAQWQAELAKGFVVIALMTVVAAAR
jgi:hypothetical protein